MPTDRIQIYAGPPIAAAIAAIGDADTVSGRLNTVAERYTLICRALLAGLRFSRAEWHAICDANNGVAIYNGERGWPAALIWAKVADTRGLADRWEIDRDDLVRRLRALSLAELIAIQEALDRVWAHPERVTDEALRECGVQYA